MTGRHRAVAAALVAVLGAGGWLALDEASVLAPEPAQAAPASRHAAASAGLDRSGLQPPTFPEPGRAAPQTDNFLTPDLRFKLEMLLLEAGEADAPAALKQRLTARVAQAFPAAEQERALALLNRYVDYRVALGAVKPPADLGDPRALRAALEARLRLRERYFDSAEQQALFASEEALDRFTLARLEIERNGALTAAQQQAAVRQAESELGEAQRAARSDALAHEAVAAQTAAFDRQGSSAQQRHAQRRSEHGDAAADRLGQLDTEERHWHARLDAYTGARQAHAGPAQLEQLAQQLFSAEERLRVDAALSLRPPIRAEVLENR